MGLLEPRIGAAGLGKRVLVAGEEGLERRPARRRHLVCESLHHDRNDLHVGRLLQPPEVIPSLPGRIAGEAGEEQPLHPVRQQHGAQGVEHVARRHGKRPRPPACDDLLELRGPHHVVGPLREEFVDRGVAHDESVRPRLLRQQHRADDVLLLVGQESRAPRVAAGRGHGVEQELIEHGAHRRRARDSALADLAPAPGRDDRVGARHPGPHLQERGQHEKGEHRQDRHENEQRTLVFPKDVERTGHGSALGLRPDEAIAEA